MSSHCFHSQIWSSSSLQEEKLSWDVGSRNTEAWATPFSYQQSQVTDLNPYLACSYLSSKFFNRKLAQHSSLHSIIKMSKWPAKSFMEADASFLDHYHSFKVAIPGSFAFVKSASLTSLWTPRPFHPPSLDHIKYLFTRSNSQMRTFLAPFSRVMLLGWAFTV